MKEFEIYQIDLDGTAVDAVSDHGIDSGLEIVRVRTDGLPHPKMTHVKTVDPSIDITSGAVHTIMNAIGTDIMKGLAITGAKTAVLYCQQVDNLGTRKANEAMKATVNQGLVIPTNLTASVDQAATVNCQIVPVYDGTNAPIATAISQTLTGSPAADEQFYSGPVYVNNVALDNVQSISIQFGIQIVKKKEGGSKYHVLAYIGNQEPVISVTTTDVEAFDAFKEGVAITAATYAQLVKAEPNGSYYANASVVHPKFTVNDGMIVAQKISGSPQSCEINIIPNKDAANAMIVYAAAAIG